MRRRSPTDPAGVEGEESNLPCGTLSLFDRSLVASPIAHVDQLPARGWNAIHGYLRR